MHALPPSPAALIGRAESRLHPHARVVVVRCRHAGDAGSVRCVVALEQRNGLVRCARVRLAARGTTWRVRSWRRGAACAPLAVVVGGDRRGGPGVSYV